MSAPHHPAQLVGARDVPHLAGVQAAQKLGQSKLAAAVEVGGPENACQLLVQRVPPVSQVHYLFLCAGVGGVRVHACLRLSVRAFAACAHILSASTAARILSR